MATVVTFLDLSVGDTVGGQFADDYAITFTPPRGNVTFDPQSPFSKVVSAAREPGSPVEFPTWTVRGTLSSPDHSRFGISVNENVTITLKDKDNRHISNYPVQSPKFRSDGSFFYGEFATGKGNIASFDIHGSSDHPFQIASITFDTVGVPHRPDFRLMLSDASIPGRDGQTGFISVTVARLYLSTGPRGDGDEAQLSLRATADINTDDVVIVTGTSSSPSTGTVTREMRYSYSELEPPFEQPPP
ncbi:hypothetical protein B0J13DRAFT_617147 [Dactylonectria estremocensis]|uniref:Uncharacterized protein n=1 Tax=Dactylonectria estremocensis TaxID=1079267 RepID=A0A9P9FEI9_9HYPO|nr:hypothetical protein B0J13DRAFT_617147 [Dactylonectria estremocensis]